MAYIVKIQTGSRAKGNLTSSGSIPLPNKERVRAFVKRSPVGRGDTKVQIMDTRTGKIKTMTKSSASLFGRNLEKEFNTSISKK